MAVSIDRRPRKDGSTAYRVSVNVSGHKRKVGTFDDEALAKAEGKLAEAELRRDIAAGKVTKTAPSKPKVVNQPAAAGTSMTSREWAGIWADKHPVGKNNQLRSKATLYSHYTQIKKWLSGPYGDTPMAEIDVDECQDWVNARPSDRDGLRSMWSDAIKSRKITGVFFNPWREVRVASRRGRKDDEMIDADQFTSLLEAAPKIHGEMVIRGSAEK